MAEPTLEELIVQYRAEYDALVASGEEPIRASAKIARKAQRQLRGISHLEADLVHAILAFDDE